MTVPDEAYSGNCRVGRPPIVRGTNLWVSKRRLEGQDVGRYTREVSKSLSP